MTRLLVSSCLWSTLDETQSTLKFAFEVLQHRNNMDGAMTLITIHVFEGFMLHLESCTTPWAIWTKFKDLFGEVNEFRKMQLEMELN